MSAVLRPEDHIVDREALIAFLTRLRKDHEENGAEWGNGTLAAFLEALESWVRSAPGWYANQAQEFPEGGDWTFFARALTAARVHE
ncbi:DUF7660 family protein [Streptomyces sp. URMC 125]|uniref:DUF7660 family protein n=1 Tax=Streptomyces sp. URMC 125 TaxID=3423419 RepID=UPI003F1D99E1